MANTATNPSATSVMRFRLSIVYEGPTLRADNEPNCITIGRGVFDSHEAAVCAGDDLLTQTPAAIGWNIWRERTEIGGAA